MANVKEVGTVAATATVTALYNRGQKAKGGNLQGAHAMEIGIGGLLALTTTPGDLPNNIGIGIMLPGLVGLIGGS